MLPAVRGRRERVARPEEARTLIAALSEGDRALCATPLYAGLRRGELQALRWSDVDLEAGLIRVERSSDQKEGHRAEEPPRTTPRSALSRLGRKACACPRPFREIMSAAQVMRATGDRSLTSEPVMACSFTSAGAV